MASQYSEDGTPLRKDGQPDQRFSSDHGFGSNRELAREAGKEGGSMGIADQEAGAAIEDGEYNVDGRDPEAEVERQAGNSE
ncbi:hypothetical protein ACM66B_004167 [Microbotryomycetes sp. NB124-2]